jgi:hypothetical protein
MSPIISSTQSNYNQNETPDNTVNSDSLLSLRDLCLQTIKKYKIDARGICANKVICDRLVDPQKLPPPYKVVTRAIGPLNMNDGHTEVVNEPVSADDLGMALINACIDGQIKDVEELLLKGNLIFQASRDNALRFAAECNHTEIVIAFLTNKSIPKTNLWPILEWAALKGHDAVVALLLDEESISEAERIHVILTVISKINENISQEEISKRRRIVEILLKSGVILEAAQEEAKQLATDKDCTEIAQLFDEAVQSPCETQ